jgi:hypothetical protein
LFEIPTKNDFFFLADSCKQDIILVGISKNKSVKTLPVILDLQFTFLAFRSKLTFKVQLSNPPSLVIIILIFFSGGNRLQIFRAHHPQHDCVDEGRFVVPQYFHCYHAGIRFRCILHLQYGFRYLYHSDSISLCKLRTRQK